MPQPAYFPHVTDEQRDAAIERLRQRGHNYIQSGNTVTCTDCPDEHGFQVPPHKLLVGTDEKGLPVFKDLTVSE